MENNNSWIKNYSIFFVFVVFSILLMQVFASEASIGKIADNFLWRNALIKSYNNLRFSLGDKVFANAVVGKEGWFYFTGDMSIQDYQKTSPISVSKMKRINDALKQLKEKTVENGGIFLLVIPPDKSTVYPQYMPDEIPVIGQISGLDRLMGYINEHSDVEIVDLRPAFEEVAKTTQIYYKTDSHWNCYGAFIAYREIVSRLALQNSLIPLYSINEFSITTVSEDSLMDIGSLMGLKVSEESMKATPLFPNSILETTNRKYPYASWIMSENSAQNAPNLMIFHDSFYTACLDEFVIPTFGYTMSVHYGDAKVADSLDLIDVEKPEIVIVEFVERQMEYYYRHLSE